MDDAVRKYWQDTLDELASYPARPEFDVLPLRSTPFATLYSVRFTSLGPYRLFGYLSIPTGTGPSPAIYYSPKYQSVLEIIPQGTANLQRSRYITFSLAGRGQRNADTPFAAMFPGLLTEGIDNAASYAFRGIVADSVRGLEFLLTRRDLDAARVVLVGNDVALIAAALTAGATHVVTTPALFYKTAELAAKTPAYPLEEINDYVRTYPARAEAARRTLGYYDLRGFAPRVTASTLLMAGAPGTLLDARALEPLVAALKGPVTVHESEQSPYKAGLYAERWMAARCGITDPLSLDEYQAHGGLKGLKRALDMAPAAIVQEVIDSGLRGRGGAGFPTGIKWRTVLQTESPRKYIVCNADEGDSGTFSDRMLMEGDPFALIEGMAIAGVATGADKGFVYIRSEYPHAFRQFTRAIEVAREGKLLGRGILGSERNFDLEARLGAGAYICGEETSLLESLEGKRGQIRFKPPLPAIAGLFGKPTVVNNVISLATVPVILAKGAGLYRDFGMGRSRGTMPLQLAGNIKRGGLIERAFGLTLREVIEEFGGGTYSGRPARAVQVGGPLGAYWPTSLFDVPIDYESFAARGGMVGHGGIVVFDDTVDLAKQARFAFHFCAVESCGKCTPCRIGARRGAETMDKIMRGQRVVANLEVVRDLCETMRDGSLCALGGLTPMPVVSAMEHFPEDFDRGAERVAAE